MTTSYDNEISTTGSSNQPSHNSEGHQVWNPSVGIYHKPGVDNRESYGGIVTALQDLIVQSNVVPKAYPHNFAGIIAAIQDLDLAASPPPVVPGPNPGNGQIIIDINGDPHFEITGPMPDGSLWFDTRQGRLFVSVNNEWYQTNGADGLPIVTGTSEAPEVVYPVPGQLWWDASENDLYIFDGLFELPDGTFTDDPLDGGTPVWKLITDGLADSLQNTATLPLAGVGVGLLMTQATRQGTLWNYINLPDMEFMKVQADYNVWLFESLYELDEALFNKSSVIIDTAPPLDPKVGDLWFDSESLELSIWYEDNDSKQWVPTSVSYSFDDDLATLSAELNIESLAREQAVHTVNERLTSIDASNTTKFSNLQTLIEAVQTAIDTAPVIDLSGYATESQLESQTGQVSARVTALENAAPDYALLMSRNEVEGELSTLEAAIQALPNHEALQAVSDSIPDVSTFVTQSDITTAIDNITVDYLPRNGGTVDGSFVINKTSYDQPAFDFSQETWTSVNALKFRTNSQAEETTTFGTTAEAYEYAWNFNGEEDFCWIYNDSNKVFSITNEGPACSTIYFGDIQPNGNNGRVIFNKIDVKERLNTYQTAFEQLRQSVASSTDFDSLKTNILSALANV